MIEVYLAAPREPGPGELESLEALSKTAAILIERTRHAEDRIASERLHDERDRLLEMVTSDRPLEDCLAALCLAVSRLSSGTSACVLLADDQRLRFRDAIAPDLPATFRQHLVGARVDDPVTGVGGDALIYGAPVTCADTATEQDRSPLWWQLCMEHGVAACHCEPVKGRQAYPVATLVLCFDRPRTPGDWEHRLAEFGSHIAGVALERERSKQALATATTESERQKRLYDAILSSTPDLVYVFDLDYRFTYANQALLEMWGRRYEDSIGKGLREIGYESWHAEMHEREIDRVVATKEPVRGEVAFPHASLGRRIYDYILVPVFNERGEVEAVSGTTRDITDRKRREEREQFLAELNRALQPIADPDEVISTAVQRLGEYLGVDRCAYAELEPDTRRYLLIGEYGRGDARPRIARRRYDSVFDADALSRLRNDQVYVIDDVATDERVSAAERRAYEQAQVCSAVFVPLQKDRQLVGALAVYQSTPRQWAPEEIDLVATVTDRCWEVIERARVARALWEREQYLSKLVETTPEGIQVLDRDGTILEMNPASIEMAESGSADAIVGTSVYDLIAPEHRATFRAFNEKVCQGQSGTLQFDLIGLKGTRRHMEASAAALSTPDGTINRLALTRDVSERVEAERALRRSERNLQHLNQTLEERVRERTDDLQRQTERLRDLAAQLTTAEQRERKRFAAMLQDDLQQLVVAARLRLAHSDDLEYDGLAERVAEVRRLLDDCLATSRNLTRQLRPPVLYEDGLVAALAGLTADVEELYRLRVSVTAGDAIPELSDDYKAMLFDAARELLVNAAKHAGVEHATVEIDGIDEAVQLTVSDQGCGFDLQEAERRALNKGFGLFSIRERLAALGGATRVESAPGQGTRVELVAPVSLRYGAGPSNIRIATGELGRAEPSGAAEKARVLLVDDHAIVRRGLAHVLSEHERIVVVGEAGDGRQAIEEVERQQPDLVLMDVNMPGMSGVEATREICSRWPDAVVLGLSVQEDTPTAKSMTEAGAAGFLPKPGDTSQMIETILAMASTGLRFHG